MNTLRRLALVMVASMGCFAHAQTIYAPATLTTSCNAVTSAVGLCTVLQLGGNSLAQGVTWQVSFAGGSAASASITLKGSNDNSSWTTLDTNTSTSFNSRSLTITAYKYLACSADTYSLGSSTSMSCGITANASAAQIGIHGTITPGDCAGWFNDQTLEDVACGGGGGTPGGSSGDLQTNNGSGGFGAAHLNDNGTTITATETFAAAVAGAKNLGTALLPWGDVFIGGAASKSLHFDTSALNANRTFTMPDANSNPVQGIANPSDSNVVNYIDTSGVQHRMAQSGGGNVTASGSFTVGHVYAANSTDGHAAIDGGVLPATESGASNNFLTSYNASAGTFGKSRPSCATLSDSGSGCSSAAGGNANSSVSQNVIAKGDSVAHGLVNGSMTDNGGVTVGSPTGGAQGAGTLNATNLYVNGVAVAAGGNVAASGSFTVGHVYVANSTDGHAAIDGGVLPAAGANTTLSNLVDTVAPNKNFQWSTGAPSGSGYINFGLPSSGTGTYQYIWDLADQNPSSHATHSTIYLQTTPFGTGGSARLTTSLWYGINNSYGGGSIDGTQGMSGFGFENNYCPSGSASWPPTGGQCQDETHIAHRSINGFYLRDFTNATDTYTGAGKFQTWTSDVGVLWKCGTGIGCTSSPVSAVTAAWTSAAGGTFTFTKPSGNWGFDVRAATTYASVTGCTPTAYNSVPNGWLVAAGGAGTTTFTVTGVGANPGSSATGCVVQGGLGYGYAAVSPTNGLQLSGAMPVLAGGILEANISSNAVGGLLLNAENTYGGGQPVSIHADGLGIAVGAACTLDANSGQPIAIPGNGQAFYCDGTHWQIMFGTQAVKDVGFNRCTTCSLSINTIQHTSGGGLDIANNYTSDTNHSGKITTTNGGGATLYDIAYLTGSGGPTPLTDVYIGGWSSIKTHIADGGNHMIDGDGNGVPSFPNASNSSGHAICWKAGQKLGYCSSVVASDGTCTCN